MTACKTLCGLLLAARLAHANGRPPDTNGVVFRPGNANDVYVRSTFGLLISHDNACTFHWVCESNLGYGGSFDPDYAIGSDGSIFVTTFIGVHVSRDGGCSFQVPTDTLPAGDPGRIADSFISTIDIGGDRAVWVATADSGSPNDVFVSTDNGVTFASAGMRSATMFWETLKVAPSDSQRIYLTGREFGTLPDGGQGTPAVHVFRSENHGASWIEGSLANVVVVGSAPQLDLLGVDSTDPATLYLASVGANAAGDRLYRSTDAGGSFSEVLATTDPITGLVFTDNAVLVATALGGTFRSSDGVTFTPIANPPQLSCLGRRDDGTLFGCATNGPPDNFEIGRSRDAVSWKPLFHLEDIAGPLVCPTGTKEHDQCDAQQWRPLQIQLGAREPEICLANTPDDAGAGSGSARGSGCCDSSGNPLGVAALSGIVALLVRRRLTRS